MRHCSNDFLRFGVHVVEPICRTRGQGRSSGARQRGRTHDCRAGCRSAEAQPQLAAAGAGSPWRSRGRRSCGSRARPTPATWPASRSRRGPARCESCGESARYGARRDNQMSPPPRMSTTTSGRMNHVIAASRARPVRRNVVPRQARPKPAPPARRMTRMLNSAGPMRAGRSITSPHRRPEPLPQPPRSFLYALYAYDRFIRLRSFTRGQTLACDREGLGKDNCTQRVG